MTKLKNILYNKSITQSALAKALNKDPATINRWCENSRLISWNNALSAAEYLKCHPTEIFNDTSLAKIELFCDSECYVECTSFEEDHQKIKVHFEDANKIFVYNNWIMILFNFSNICSGGFKTFKPLYLYKVKAVSY